LPKLSHKNKPACRRRFNIAEEFFHAGPVDAEETVLEYLKALTVTRASAGRYDERIVPLAEARLAQCLLGMGRTEAAARHQRKATAAGGKAAAGGRGRDE
jgi:hypothetical protein